MSAIPKMPMIDRQGGVQVTLLRTYTAWLAERGALRNIDNPSRLVDEFTQKRFADYERLVKH